jgi:hypothetical protein
MQTLPETVDEPNTLRPGPDPFTELCELKFSLECLLPRLTLEQTRRVVLIADAMVHGRRR